MQQVIVGGVGMTRFGRQPDRTVAAMATEAVSAALADAGIAADDVDRVFFSNAVAGIVTGQECVRGQVALRRTALVGKPIVNVENACASGSTAVNLAWLSVASGQSDVVLVVGAEKLTAQDNTLAMKGMEGALDPDERAEFQARNAEGARRSVFMDVYAGLSRDYMAASGATREDFARVASKNSEHGSLNPLAQFHDVLQPHDVLAAREIVQPLTLPMCSPIGDGAAALVLVSEAVARKLGMARVRIIGTAVASGAAGTSIALAPTRAARAAYAMAGIGPNDIQVAEVHDATAPAEMMLYEELDFCPSGEGPAFLRSGAPRLGGRLVVNPSGGLLRRGHPVGATGCAQLVELTQQLRGRAGARQVQGARVALAQNGGGFIGNDVAASAVTILAV